MFKRKKQSVSEISRALEKGIRRAGMRTDGARDAAFRTMILSIPKGKVATYGQVAAAAGFPL